MIGVERGAIIQRFLTGLPQRFETATENPRLNGVLVKADETRPARDLGGTREPVRQTDRRAGLESAAVR